MYQYGLLTGFITVKQAITSLNKRPGRKTAVLRSWLYGDALFCVITVLLWLWLRSCVAAAMMVIVAAATGIIAMVRNRA